MVITKGKSPYSFSVCIAMLVGGFKTSVNMPLYPSPPNWMEEIPDHLKTQEM